jgi:hypothetical protein
MKVLKNELAENDRWVDENREATEEMCLARLTRLQEQFAPFVGAAGRKEDDSL